MSEHYTYHAGSGPHYFDDTDPITVDQDGDPGTTDGCSPLPGGLTAHAVVTDHQLYVGKAPTLPQHVVRLGDTGSVIPTVTVSDIMAPDLSAYSNPLVLVIGTIGGKTELTLYGFALGATDTVLSPVVIAGNGGIYKALCGYASAS